MMNNLKRIYVVFVMLGLVVQSLAQLNTAFDRSKAIKVGDRFDEPLKVEVMRGRDRTIDWNLIQDKVVVLDFFDTYCGACIEAMPRLQQLQNKLVDKLKVINVTWQDKATLEKFFKSNRYLKEYQVDLSVIYNDTYLRSLFPYQGAPHVVMVFKGKVQAITFASAVTETNILELYNKGFINLPYKNDFAERDISLDKNKADTNLIAGTYLSRYQNGVPNQALKFETDSMTHRFRTSTYNRSIFRILLNAWTKIEVPNFVVRPDRVQWKVKNIKLYEDIDKVGEEWNSKFGICYERFDIRKQPDSVQAKLVLQDMHQFLGIKSYWMSKNMECLILRSCDRVKPPELKSVKGTKYEGTAVLSTMIDILDKYPPVLDQVKSQEMIALSNVSSIEEINMQLRQYGMELVQGKGDLKVFVIEEISER